MPRSATAPRSSWSQAPVIPTPGETAREWWSGVGHDKAIAALVERLGRMSSWGPQELAEVFLHDVPAEIAQASERFNRAPGPGMFREPWPLSGWPDVPTRVLAPRDDRLFPLAFQQRVTRERLGLPVHTLPGGHIPMLARPEELAAHLATPRIRHGEQVIVNRRASDDLEASHIRDSWARLSDLQLLSVALNLYSA